MKVINLNTQDGVEMILFPDGQPHIKLTKYIHEDDIVTVVASLINSNRVIQLLEIVDALTQLGCIKYLLEIPYLMGARYDRIMDENGSFDLRVIANIINSMDFVHVNILDPHSDVSTALIKNSRAINNRALVDEYNLPDSVLIIPDAGAAKKAENYFKWNKNIVESVQCIKHRDLSTGKITLKVLEPQKCYQKNCVIIDDLCDGGATFNAIAEQIYDQTNPLHMTLIVTHGIFSKGMKELENNFDLIISSDSYTAGVDGHILKRIHII